MDANALEDPELDVPGSFDEVAETYCRGDLTLAQYAVLADAAADSARAESPGDS